uniref:Calpain_III domain-containing protein n=1 Tax=Bursaphelenchus xylophilus TaxID=6326 RepID=A0A1I7S6L4_BURXY
MLVRAPPESSEETQNLPVEHPNEANLEKAYEKSGVSGSFLAPGSEPLRAVAISGCDVLLGLKQLGLSSEKIFLGIL